VILAKGKNAEEFQKQLLFFVGPKLLNIDTTLLLVDETIASSCISTNFKKMQRMRLAQDPKDIVQHIIYYIEAGVEAGT